MELNMELTCKFILLIFYVAPVWCTSNRTKRTTQQHPPTELTHLHQNPNLEYILSLLCRPNNKIPFFRRRQEQVVAVNEQLMPQFLYPFDNHHHPHHQDGNEDIFYEGHLNNPTQFPSHGYDSQIFPPSTNEYGINQQFINYDHKDKHPATQVQKPPTSHGHRYSPNSFYHPHSNNYHKNQGAINKDEKTINIDVDASTKQNAAVNNIGNKDSRVRQAVSPYDQFNNQYPYPNPMNYRSPYGQDLGYSASALYPRSIPYLGESDFPVDFMYSSVENDPLLSDSYGPVNNQMPRYYVDPRIITAFDEYIQRKIDASQNKLKENDQNVTINTNTNNQTTTT